MNNFRLQMAANLRHVRLNAGVSKTRLSRLTGIYKSTISQYESGLKSPEVYDVAILAKALDVCTDDIIPEAEWIKSHEEETRWAEN